MFPLLAELTIDERRANRRGAARRSLKLEVHATSSRDATRALIRDLSVRGLLIETTADLAVGETIHVALPEAGATEARIVWATGAFFGCEFASPISKAAVSAALLLAPSELTQPVSPLPHMPVATNLGDEQAQPEPASEFQKPASRIVVVASLVLLLLIATMFIYALLVAPFST